ncbi:DNA polymerase III subunit delta [Clostridium oryzae]|uniref:DNA polymerase III subunit delta n=1 Tax=Clostridium oryzae TaxID=1450648 RepID=A0A1V4IV62_9CLOT|nr:DNA polymerase III subunit delta [Clostridium oryzae]OPJ63793.1 DNA polymerase III subunit delta [Clostridium oryzae]
MDFDAFEQNIKKKIFKNCYVLYGIDENLMKEAVTLLTDNMIDKNFMDLNFVKYDGEKVSYDDIINACETLPFMSERKLVVVYRANFLSDSEDKEGKKKFEALSSYIEKLPDYCTLVMYYVFENDREKASSRVKKLEKKCETIKVDRLKGDRLYRRVNELFESKGKEINRALLKFFCDHVENNMDIMNSEAEKLIAYTLGREITKKDIMDLLSPTNEDDIFDLVDFLAQKKPEKAINILNELIFRGENIGSIMYMIVRQFRLLFNIKLGVSEGKRKDELAKELRLHPYICEKMMAQSGKFTLTQLKNCMHRCLDAEVKIKSSSIDKKLEMEMLIINSVR